MKRALTLHPEWAWAIQHLDKRVENRGYALPVGEWIGLHAGKHIGGRPGKPAETEGLDGLVHMAGRAGWRLDGNNFVRRDQVVGDQVVTINRANVVTSAMLGAFRVTQADAPGVGDLDGWRVYDAWGNLFEWLPLARPVPCRGAQGLWTIPADVLAQMREVGRG